MVRQLANASMAPQVCTLPRVREAQLNAPEIWTARLNHPHRNDVKLPALMRGGTEILIAVR